MSLFPPHQESRLEFCRLLNACLDVIDIRQRQTSLDQDLRLLHAIDEKLAAYGWLTNTGLRLLIIIDMAGRPVSDNEKRGVATVAGLRDSDLKPVGIAMVIHITRTDSD
jgi:trafficking protein particle complex subunit 2